MLYKSNNGFAYKYCIVQTVVGKKLANFNELSLSSSIKAHHAKPQLFIL